MAIGLSDINFINLLIPWYAISVALKILKGDKNKNKFYLACYMILVIPIFKKNTKLDDSLYLECLHTGSLMEIHI